MLFNVLMETEPGSNRFTNGVVVFPADKGKEPPDGLLQAARFANDFLPGEEYVARPDGPEIFGVFMVNGVPGRRCIVGWKPPYEGAERSKRRKGEPQ
jgi:hypothetical protein